MRPLEYPKDELKAYELGDWLTYDLVKAGSPDWVDVLLGNGSGFAAGVATWPAGLVIDAERAGNHVDLKPFPTPVQFTATGSFDRLRVTGARRFRLRVSVKGGAAQTIAPVVTPGWDK